MAEEDEEDDDNEEIDPETLTDTLSLFFVFAKDAIPKKKPVKDSVTCTKGHLMNGSSITSKFPVNCKNCKKSIAAN